MTTTKFIATGFLTAALASFCAAQSAQPAQPASQQGAPSERGNEPRRRPDVVGKITAVNGQTFTITSSEGKNVTVTATDSTRLMKDRQPAKIGDFKVGDMAMVRGHSTGTDTWEAEFIGSRTGGMEGGPGAGGMGSGGFSDALGKKFIAGEIKSIDGTHLSIASMDGQTQTIAVDENTSFKKQGESITLADFKVGDRVFGPGELKDGTFTASRLMLGDPHRMHGDPEGNKGPDQK